eukprot:12311609-Ditylum_brightwellii.AAC.1
MAGFSMQITHLLQKKDNPIIALLVTITELYDAVCPRQDARHGLYECNIVEGTASHDIEQARKVKQYFLQELKEEGSIECQWKSGDGTVFNKGR